MASSENLKIVSQECCEKHLLLKKKTFSRQKLFVKKLPKDDYSDVFRNLQNKSFLVNLWKVAFVLMPR